jgi:hypothetical protein
MVIDLYLNAKKIYRVFIPGLDYLKDSMKLHVLGDNYYASKVAVENGHDVSFPLIPASSSLSFGQESSYSHKDCKK